VRHGLPDLGQIVIILIVILILFIMFGGHGLVDKFLKRGPLAVSIPIGTI